MGQDQQGGGGNGSEPVSNDRTDDYGRSRRDSQGEKDCRLIWEMPLGTKRGYLDEPGPRFVDVEGEAELEAMRWERGLSTIDSQRPMAGKVDPVR